MNDEKASPLAKIALGIVLMIIGFGLMTSNTGPELDAFAFLAGILCFCTGGANVLSALSPKPL